ncbi:Deoxyribose-phosphate aldolase [bacterium HR08]|nr:Deoxyribose-phosphate aldolase [bacterium HR08]
MEIDRQLVADITEAIFAKLRELELIEGPGPSECFQQQFDLLREAIALGVERLGGKPEPADAARDLARYIDHTLLRPEATRQEVLRVCEEALSYGFAAVVVNPYWVRDVARRLHGSGVKPCTVVGFPLGATLTDVKVYEARRAIFDGAREIDMVINIGALKSGQDEVVERDIRAVVEACHELGALCKVILETALLTEEEKVKACVLAKRAGADFVKTSTGFSRGGATIEDVLLMRRVVGPEMGVKAAGGIRDAQTARRLLEAGATRLGASAGVKIVREAACPSPQP